MSEKEATEEQITEALNKIMETHDDNAVKLLAKLLFNVRFDLDELKIELVKCLGGIGLEVEEGEELKYPDKKIDKECRRFYFDLYT